MLSCERERESVCVSRVSGCVRVYEDEEVCVFSDPEQEGNFC